VWLLFENIVLNFVPESLMAEVAKVGKNACRSYCKIAEVLLKVCAKVS
jgi:hypothetical protein